MLVKRDGEECELKLAFQLSECKKLPLNSTT